MTPGTAQELWKRRVPHMVGVYLGISWAVLEFVGFLVDQYLLSPLLVTFSLVTLASLLPSAFIIAFFHGAPGRQGWTTAEKVTIPANLLVLAAFLILMFWGKDLGATTTAVTVTDEEGVSTDRIIPKAEFRKRVVLFPFSREEGGSTPEWLQYGVPLGIFIDLRQDLFVTAENGLTFSEEMVKAGYEEGLGLPLALMRRLAREAHFDRFVSGSIGGTETEPSVDMTLHDTGRGKEIGEWRFSGGDAFQLIDSMTVQLKRGLQVPERHLEEARDLTIAEIQTESLVAFRSAVEGYVAAALKSDLEAATAHFEAAVAEDPTYASAQHSLFQTYAFSNRFQDGLGAINAAMEHLYRLPEREQIQVKSDYYFAIQDYEKAYAVFAMWVELFPDDLEGRADLAQVLLIQGRQEEAMEQYLAILESDPEQYDALLSVGRVLESQGEFSEALAYYEAYAEQFPEGEGSYLTIGNLQAQLGNHQQAQENYEKALLIDPSSVAARVRLAEIRRDLGDREEALAQLEQGLAAAKTPEELATAYEALQAYHEAGGQLVQALDYFVQAQVQREKYLIPLSAVSARFRSIDLLVRSGRVGQAYETLEGVRAELAPPWDGFLPIGQVYLYLALENPDSAELALGGVEAFVRDFSLNNLMPFVFSSRGEIQELRGEYREGIQSYEEELELNPSDESIHEDLGRCYRELGELDTAEEYLLKALAIHPFDGSAHYEMALVQEGLGDVAAARDHLNVALDVWSEADSVFRPAQQARAKYAELSSRN